MNKKYLYYIAGALFLVMVLLFSCSGPSHVQQAAYQPAPVAVQQVAPAAAPAPVIVQAAPAQSSGVNDMLTGALVMHALTSNNRQPVVMAPAPIQSTNTIVEKRTIVKYVEAPKPAVETPKPAPVVAAAVAPKPVTVAVAPKPSYAPVSTYKSVTYSAPTRTSYSAPASYSSARR